MVRQWLVKCGEIYGREITEPLVSLWVTELSSVSANIVDQLFRKHLRTSRFFPVPADILQPLAHTAELHRQDGAENDWHRVLDYVREWVHPDIVFSRTPMLPEKLDRCARAAGGLQYLRACPTEELIWRKKQFLEAYERYDCLDQHLIEDPELKKLFQRFANRFSLPE